MSELSLLHPSCLFMHQKVTCRPIPGTSTNIHVLIDVPDVSNHYLFVSDVIAPCIGDIQTPIGLYFHNHVVCFCPFMHGCNQKIIKIIYQIRRHKHRALSSRPFSCESGIEHGSAESQACVQPQSHNDATRASGETQGCLSSDLTNFMLS